MQILDATRRAETELNAEVVVIKKTSPEYAVLKDKPACPSVFVNGKCIATKCTITYEALKAAIQSDSEG